jgi:hypothetical protein
LVSFFGISQVAVHKQLNKLLEEQKIIRVGKPPVVIYLPATPQVNASRPSNVVTPPIAQEAVNFINKQYLYITPQGQIRKGFEGFVVWWQAKNKQEKLENLVEEYLKTVKMYEIYRNSYGWIDATEKVAETFKNDNNLDEVTFVDFYSYPKFGKTKLGQLILHGKQSEQIELIYQVIEEVRPIISRIIRYYQIDSVGFIPPSLPRKIQFMQTLQAQLGLDIPLIDLRKSYSGEVTIAQKSLSSTQERIENASNTIHLLIDDALGSGATLNETARKIKSLPNFKGKIIGCALAGSINGFEVIKEI